MAKMLVAGFPNPDEADAVVEELEQMGYHTQDFSIITAETRDEVHHHLHDQIVRSHSLGEGATSGAAAGTVVGGVTGLLAGAGVVPALAGLLIGGPIAVALGATGVVATTISGLVTGAAAGGLIGTLTHLGLPETAARSYSDIITVGGLLLGVPIVEEEQEEDIRAVFVEHGAQDTVDFDLDVE